MFCGVSLEDRVPARHPLRLIRRVAGAVLATMDGDFARLCQVVEERGWPIGHDRAGPSRIKLTTV